MSEITLKELRAKILTRQKEIEAVNSSANMNTCIIACIIDAELIILQQEFWKAFDEDYVDGENNWENLWRLGWVVRNELILEKDVLSSENILLKNTIKLLEYKLQHGTNDKVKAEEQQLINETTQELK